MPKDELILQNFNELFSIYRNRFILFAYSYVDNKEVAEDIVMDSFMYYWEKRSDLADTSNIPGYILTVIKHKCLNYLKHKLYVEKAHSEINTHQNRVIELNISSLEVCDPQELFVKELEALLIDALQKLPELTRIVFISSRLNNKTYKEISADLDITVKSIEYHLSKATKFLKENLKDYLPLFLLISFIK
ncbi:RNA polymerase sigma-70 factor [Dysgonomonas sp. Marseille-P4677]|uniref:RNA polymerase sigma-70 factor n=1 Tax=Dysgonomonas sp. Marseille-P4677 TaxID=2364790 RepID=UPI001914D390|nr:RNA polymerase sigma-70 factor [Dysgonomonas sp. Marseille-P4677]MBK5723116.1 RNA polymerase sigma-70 factor [Dysgonomonas sp. Marseille-P4677]